MADVAVSPSKKRVIKTPKKTVLFVCTGNTCRSAMAEYILKYLLKNMGKLTSYRVISAGLAATNGQAMSDNAKTIVKNLGFKQIRHKATQLKVGMVKAADLVVCMTPRHKAAIVDFGDKVKTVGEITGGQDVADPFGQGLDVYSSVADYLMYACGDIIEIVEKN